MTPQTRIAFLGRSARFSPNAVGKDTAVLAAVRQRLQAMGYHCADIVWEDRPADMEDADAYVSMGRKQNTLNWLGDFERRWVPVVNCTASVMICNHRTLLMQVLEESGIPVPPLIGGDGYWVKRGYGCRETDADVQYAPDRATADRLGNQLLERGAMDVDIRAHVAGDWLKFYAVRGTDFFHYYFPQSESHQTPDVKTLCNMTAEAADLVQLDVYGGDCIIRPDGQPVLIDLNDWPSFSRCREEAAEAIAERIKQKLEERR